ncbi:hypothetical protein [Arcobacter porcinus]|uniref:Uncharacterized protein n=1 Tax=Arcobacter porcinus TaxID=1935204 RepID=A0A5C2HFC0_9BACT|nr:hypothetical protein [Arcobacter porcinus]OCL90666.1 hypothetical protein AAX27_01477 [Aliarcobacter thereius]QEP40824.1 hypothetical protein APORC_1228 [Arcobacter porcinus]
MNKKISDSNLLASLAVFRQLQESGKSINDILNEFIVDIIKTNGLYSFSSKEVNSLLNETYDFQIPDAVVALSLKKIDALTNKNGLFTINDSSKLDSFNIEKQKNLNSEKHILLISQLHEYIELKNNKKLSDKDKNDIEHALSNFILDNRVDNGYSDFISAFIIENKNNVEFINTWDTIREGVVLYTGLKYNPNLQTKIWNTNLTIYVNMEIIFHFAGYNGTLYKTLIDDLYLLIKEINAKQKYIHLKYLAETKEEIESFFYSAENIIQKGSSVNINASAMRNIINGCTSSTDILIKKEKLFSLLSNSGIFEENMEDIYKTENHKFNITTSELYDKYQEVDDIEDITKKLNYISIKRGEREQNNFENIGYILLTESRHINLVAWDETIKEQGQVPLATNMQFLTNKFWFKLNKGFGKKDCPISFKITTKAQILLSSHLTEKIRNSYLELQQQINNGSITEDIALKVLCELKTRSKLPEELQDENMNDILSSLDSTLDDYILEHENVKKLAIESGNKNIELEEVLQNTVLEKKQLELEHENITQKNTQLQENLINKENEANNYKEKYLLQQQEKLSTLIQKKEKSEKKLDYICSLLKFIFVFLVLIIFVKTAMILEWDNTTQKIIWIVSVSLTILSYFYRNKIEFIKEMTLKFRKIIQSGLYKYYGFKEEIYKTLEVEIKSILDSQK